VVRAGFAMVGPHVLPAVRRRILLYDY